MEYNKNDPQSIQAMFDSIAKQYDRTNAVLSFCLHKHWNAALIKQTLKSQEAFLDLCCGTGEIAFSHLKKTAVPQKAYLIDFSDGMLQCAKHRAASLKLSHHSIQYIAGDAQEIPLPHESVEAITIAYGIRNIKIPKMCLQESLRVLKKGGRLGILELTQPKNKLLRYGHQFYLKNCLPLVGKLLTSNKEAYRYLCNSIHSFIKPDELEQLMQEVGFVETTQKPLLGGIATIISGKKK
jgi:demethylmenaquinone methyltransferase / 2-methoxy-6-polyprenyl-1,4-benzoquinol methylase